jgi:hypothetical protein
MMSLHLETNDLHSVPGPFHARDTVRPAFLVGVSLPAALHNARTGRSTDRPNALRLNRDCSVKSEKLAILLARALREVRWWARDSCKGWPASTG